MKSVVLQTRLSPELKAKAEKVFQGLGLSLNDGVRMFLNQVTIDRGFPFRPTLDHYPNEQTRRRDR